MHQIQPQQEVLVTLLSVGSSKPTIYILHILRAFRSLTSNMLLCPGLSHNHISELGEEAFTNLLFLRTLLLDHNLLTSEALQGGALTSLSQLEVLSLGHNLIRMVGTSAGEKLYQGMHFKGNVLVTGIHVVLTGRF